jgi:hypothetical protein
MASDSRGPAEPGVNHDVKRLQADAEKAKYLETIAKSQQGVADAKAASLKSLLPSVTDAPKGEVTLGDKAGAFGPWRAHEMIGAAAQQIAGEVKPLLRAQAAARVLVVNDRSLLEGDWTARHVRDTVTRLTRRIDALRAQLRAGQTKLDQCVRDYGEAEARQLTSAAPQDAGRRTAAETAPARRAPTGALPPGVPGALGAAVDLLGLIRTDYTVTASTVTPGPAELVTLTAARLAAAGVRVEADVFSTMRASPTMDKLTGLLNDRDDVVEMLYKLTETLAPVEAELAALAGRIAVIEPQWAQAVADAKEEASVRALQQAVETLAGQARSRELAAGPARALETYAQQVVADVDAAVTALLQAPAGGQAPLFTAAQRERLDRQDGAQDAITHVLYVSLDAVAADTVTRRSILGASGVLRFLTATNASWLLLDTATGTIAKGSQNNNADLMTFSLETGEAAYGGTPQRRAGSVIKDPMRALEGPVKFLVVVLAIVLIVFGLLSLLAVIRVVVG